MGGGGLSPLGGGWDPRGDTYGHPPPVNGASMSRARACVRAHSRRGSGYRGVGGGHGRATTAPHEAPPPRCVTGWGGRGRGACVTLPAVTSPTPPRGVTQPVPTARRPVGKLRHGAEDSGGTSGTDTRTRTHGHARAHRCTEPQVHTRSRTRPRTRVFTHVHTQPTHTHTRTVFTRVCTHTPPRALPPPPGLGPSRGSR